MSYKIAAASEDGEQINLNFGAAQRFLIYEVNEDGVWTLLEERSVPEGLKEPSGCGSQSCGSGEGGCHGSGAVSRNVDLLSDCRCIVCKKIGFPIQKQFEKKTISTFEISGSLNEVLDKITLYFYRSDHHQTLKGIAKQ